MITYRDATSADAGTLTALFAETFTATFGHLYTPGNLAAFLATANRANWQAELADPSFRVRLAEEDGFAIGYAKLGPPKLPVTPRGPSAELRQLYVRAAWHGGGVAPTLMDWAIATAREGGARDLYLSVFIENARARRFYDKLGFERIGSYAFMVGDHEDEDDVMRLAL